MKRGSDYTSVTAAGYGFVYHKSLTVLGHFIGIHAVFQTGMEIFIAVAVTITVDQRKIFHSVSVIDIQQILTKMSV